jgi:hypothetical protein
LALQVPGVSAATECEFTEEVGELRAMELRVQGRYFLRLSLADDLGVPLDEIMNLVNVRFIRKKGTLKVTWSPSDGALATDP